ncbi:MAG: hypothetical protein PHH31_09245, partial [Acidaminococcaceae bacterium]|nr:hypothetical protein [Acidaminococcaceae bacterium]
KVKYYATNFEVYNEKGNRIYFENSNGSWGKWEYDEKDSMIYLEDSNGYWYKSEYDEKGDVIYCEDKGGILVNKRVKELTIEQIEELLGYKIKIKGK